MSAKYKCDTCGRKLPCRNNKFIDSQWVGEHLRVQFVVDFNQDTDMDICIPCALKTIQDGAKESKKDINNINAIKHAENCQYG
jgi:hypothetical protein